MIRRPRSGISQSSPRLALETVPGAERRGVISDPDGNRITFFESSG